MKRYLLLAALLAAFLLPDPARAAGMFEGFPDATFPLSGDECVPADTNLSGGRTPQTQCIDMDKIRGYVSPVNAQEIASTTSVNLDLSVSDTFSTTIHVSAAFGDPSNVSNGQNWTLLISQGGTADWSPTFNTGTWYWPSGTAPDFTLTTGATYSFSCTTVDSIQYCRQTGASYAGQ